MMEEIFTYWGIWKSFWLIRDLFWMLGSPKQPVCGWFNMHWASSALATKESTFKNQNWGAVVHTTRLKPGGHCSGGFGHTKRCPTLVIIQFSSAAQSCPTLCDPMNRSTPGLPVHHHLPEFTQTCVHWVSDAIQPSHPLSSPSPPALNLSQDQGLFQWVNSSHQVAKVLEFQLQHQSFQWTPRADLL